ncbi:MAG: DUF3604 domain-containing protein [Gammaproteobacteria bacterium]|nr:DUF3604 domain-containing protein [Gammaproteobacteria bacterium]NNM11604.1 DUF3604 domain-containing protein [Pseudomonadales bacterium]
MRISRLFGCRHWPVVHRSIVHRSIVHRSVVQWLALLLGFALLAACSKLEDPTLHPAFDPANTSPPPPKPATAPSELRNAFFGDLHIHTSLSTDAFVMGVRAMPDDVYRFAKGHAIAHAAGYPIQIKRPLDFAAITDHAEYLGEARLANIDYPTTKKTMREILLEGNAFSITKDWLQTVLKFRKQGFGLTEPNKEILANSWQLTIDAAQRHNEPGVFTSFIGYEWSSYVGEIAVHIHRCVIYRDSKVSALPFSSLDSSRPEDLWKFLQRESDRGIKAFAIPHNANVSKGNMYARVDSNGKALTHVYAEARRRWEPISEILQIKGASETHPLLSAEDEFANFSLASMQPGDEPEGVYELQGSYMRDALRTGIEMQRSEGFNPFRFGVIGSTDSHNASSPTEESDYSGKLPIMDGSAGLRTNEATLLPKGINPANSWSSGGLAGIWAKENTRESLFDAMRRKETFATSGPRIMVRFFAGWDYDAALLSDAGFVAKAYAQGVSMGGQISNASKGSSPRFLVAALKDPIGANLDRVQIIKGWSGVDGQSHEKIYNVALSGNREVAADGSAQPVGNTVDLATASYSNSIGAAELSAFWQDPDFKPGQNAFYYARVLEIPTPRWSTYDAVKLGSEPMQPATIQERAITSAIWYSP